MILFNGTITENDCADLCCKTLGCTFGFVEENVCYGVSFRGAGKYYHSDDAKMKEKMSLTMAIIDRKRGKLIAIDGLTAKKHWETSVTLFPCVAETRKVSTAETFRCSEAKFLSRLAMFRTWLNWKTARNNACTNVSRKMLPRLASKLD